MANAIATMEGFFQAGSIAQRNANPGNLRSWGERPVVNGYARFLKADGVSLDPDAGWKALRVQISKNINRSLTLQEFFGGVRDAAGNPVPGKYTGFSPGADGNHPTQYAQYVAGKCGIPTDVPLDKVVFTSP
jgi:hypothetical protein